MSIYYYMKCCTHLPYISPYTLSHWEHVHLLYFILVYDCLILQYILFVSYIEIEIQINSIWVTMVECKL